ncbi:hypothetical protein [Paraburkholderia guartelaensis]|uniref:hypothetical protein n=1 Tax=Paraburkholderia guartelaensis TaxID=2546446 RepID=UPI0026B7B900
MKTRGYDRRRRGARGSGYAVHARDVMLQVFLWAMERGHKLAKAAELVCPTSIANFELPTMC